MALITQQACNELILKSEFLFQNADMLVSLAFISTMSVGWLVIYAKADILSQNYGVARIQKLLHNIILLIALFCLTMLVYILNFK